MCYLLYKSVNLEGIRVDFPIMADPGSGSAAKLNGSLALPTPRHLAHRRIPLSVFAVVLGQNLSGPNLIEDLKHSKPAKSKWGTANSGAWIWPKIKMLLRFIIFRKPDYLSWGMNQS